MLLSACGPAAPGDGPPESGPGSPIAVSQLTPQQVFRLAADASGGQASYRAEVNEFQEVPQEEGYSAVTRKVFRGLYQRSGRYQVSGDISFETPESTISYQSEVIGIEGTRYVTDPESGEWNVDAHAFPKPLEEIVLPPPLLQTLEFGPDETLDGESVFHLAVTPPPDEDGRRQRFEYWIGRRDSLFKQATWSIEWPGENNDFIRTYRFYDFGVAAEINPPVTSEILRPIDPDIWLSEPIDPQDISWENVTLDQPGRALIKGIQSEGGSCGMGSSLSPPLKEGGLYAGVWSRTIGSDNERCVWLIEYGYSTREDLEKRKQTELPMRSVTAEPAQPPDQPTEELPAADE